MQCLGGKATASSILYTSGHNMFMWDIVHGIVQIAGRGNNYQMDFCGPLWTMFKKYPKY